MSLAIIVGSLTVSWFVVPVLLKLTVFKPAKCRSSVRLDGKVVLVTGANTGLGKVTAKDLASRGAVVYIACRDVTKAEAAKRDILSSNSAAQVNLLKLDLGSLRSVRDCADAFKQREEKLDVLVANAGFGSLGFSLTEDGVESHLGVNHLGHFYLTRLLLPCLEKAGTDASKSRIVVVSSVAHKMARGPMIQYEKLQKGEVRRNAYGQSKLANLLFVKYFDSLLAGRNITINGLHPGTVKTEFFRNYFPYRLLNTMLSILCISFYYMLLTEEEGSQTNIWASVSEELEGVSGKYLKGCKISSPSVAAQNVKEAEKLWKWSCEKTGLPHEL
ncbi:RDH12 [Bugula neritina]|uniref:RDH12 n=1 Tax=Bugula neritina TaxID=10212 RepID=A0A7J7K6J0_BUGNE|nr:RDH12 [Bugula neritina]